MVNMPMMERDFRTTGYEYAQVVAATFKSRFCTFSGNLTQKVSGKHTEARAVLSHNDNTI